MNVSNQEFLDDLFQQYLQHPESVPAEWQTYFQNFIAGQPGNSLATATVSGSARPSSNGAPSKMAMANLQDRVDQLIRGYRVRGHLEARIDPLGIPRRQNRELDPYSYGFTDEDFSRRFSTRTISGADELTLEEIVDKLRETYCRSIGAQFMHIDDYTVRNWLQSKMESTQNRLQLSHATMVRILTRLTDASIFEEFVRRKYIGQKTFSLEGGETLIPLLDLALEKAGEHGVQEAVLGMAHRGRLNVLANIMHKRAQNIFWSIDEADHEMKRGRGDVLYHMGYSSDWVTHAGHKIHISLCFNPSHLEFVNAVAMGRCRSKQDRFHDSERRRCLNILIHGDAAFAGEGIVQETLNMSELPGYAVGGTLHVILNNQIGFTTPAEESRSTTYCSDVAKMLQIPIFHVNGEDPEAVAQVVDLAMEFRSVFKRDVVIDMYCYRRHGHNESDEPRFTQPTMYQTIDHRPTVREMYVQQLLKSQKITAEEAETIVQQRREELESEFEAAKISQFQSDVQTLGGFWNHYYGGLERDDDLASTGVSAKVLSEIFLGLGRTPPDFNVNRKLQRVIDARAEMALEDRPIDWAGAELAAIASLSLEGHSVRLSGQDAERGTFSHRHAVLNDAQSGAKYQTLKNIRPDQASVEIYNSPLCEAGVMGFEYGYSLDAPESLVMWEAQFGDFWNVAQVIVDQFISSAEDKWRRLSGITMLLPHGFEGAGPEHCSARLERFLTLAAEHNMQIVYPTSAAQYFHLLRRQVHRKWRKPLVVLTPKSLLREPLVMSPFADLTTGRFQRVLQDPRVAEIQSPSRILLCSGKIAIDLIKAREDRKADDVAVVRLEQLYPLHRADIEEALQAYPAGTPVVWIQEEPRNMGARNFLRLKWEDLELHERYPLSFISRPESASPSTGSKKMHQIEQNELLDMAFAVPSRVAR